MREEAFLSKRMRLKAKFTLVLFVLLYFSTLYQTGQCPYNSYTSPRAELVVTPKLSTIITGTLFTCTVNIVDAYEVYSYQFYMNWSIPILDVTSITQGPFLSKGGAYSTSFVQKKFNTEGYLLVGCTQTTGDLNTAQSGNGTLATITFLAETIGSTTLHLYNTKVKDFFGAEYNHITDDGYVSVEIVKVVMSCGCAGRKMLR